MSTSTTRLNLTKPASSENVDINVLDINFDLVDAAVGVTVGASSARPASAFSGRLWYDTDNGYLRVNTASSASTAASWQKAVGVIASGFSETFDVDLTVQGHSRSSPTLQSVGAFIQHRVSGALGTLVHDATCTELRMSGASTTAAGQNALESSFVVTGGVNTISKANSVLANWHAEGTPTGSISEVAMFRAAQAPSHGASALPVGFTIDKIYGIYLDDQIFGTTENWSLYSAGKIGFAYASPISTTAAAVLARGRSDTLAGTSLLTVQNSATTNLLRVTEAGSLVMGAAALTTSASSGFIYTASMAGTPSGTPTSYTGAVPFVIDTSASKLWAYIGGAWKSVTLT